MNNQLKDTIIDIDFIKKLIPQKDPFVMVDKLLYFDSQQLISGLRITADNILTDGKGYFTEAGLIEHMAQSMALHRGYQGFVQAGKDTKPKTGFIGAIKFANIHCLPKVGEELTTTATIIADIMNVVLIAVEIRDTKDKMIASSEMKTVIVDA